MEALALIDDWDGEHKASLTYRTYWLLLRIAAANGIKISKEDELEMHQFIPFGVKQIARPENNTEEFRKLAQKRYG